MYHQVMAEITNAAAAHFRAGLEELEATRRELQTQLSRVETTIAAVNALLSTERSVISVGEFAVYSDPVPAVREVLDEFSRGRESFTFDEFMDALREAGNDAKTSSVTSIISRDENIERLGRGVYRRRQDSEAPADSAGASDHANCSAVDAAGPGREEMHDDRGGHLHTAPVAGSVS
jgi:hypothetical protein